MFQQPIVTISSDFQENYSSAQIEGVVRCLSPDTIVVRATDLITPFCIKEGGFVLWDLARFYPANSIHIAVIDPGVGTDRRVISVHTPRGIFVGPDNGLFDVVAQRFGVTAAYSYPVPQFNGTTTFQGRDVFAKIAAAWANREVPYEKTAFNYLTRTQQDLSPTRYEVLHVDGYGNLKLDRLEQNWQRFVGLEHKTRRFDIQPVATFHQASKGQLILYPGSSEVLELAVVEANAAQLIGAHVGDQLELTVA